MLLVPLEDEEEDVVEEVATRPLVEGVSITATWPSTAAVVERAALLLLFTLLLLFLELVK